MNHAQYTVPRIRAATIRGLAKGTEGPAEAPSYNILPRAPTAPISAREHLARFIEEPPQDAPADLAESLIEAATHEAALKERERWINGIENGIEEIARRYQGVEDGAVISALETLRKRMIELP